MSDWPAQLQLKTAALAFPRADDLVRFTIADTDVGPSSRIVGMLRKQDVAEEDDVGRSYDFDVVRRQHGSFDVVVKQASLGEDATPDILADLRPAISYAPSNQGALLTSGPNVRNAESISSDRGGWLARVQLPRLYVTVFDPAQLPIDPTTVVVLELRSDTAGHPGALLDSTQFPVPNLVVDETTDSRPATWWLSNPIRLTPGATYWLVVYATPADPTNSNGAVILQSASGSTTKASSNAGATWPTTGYDMAFSATIIGEQFFIDYAVLP